MQTPRPPVLGAMALLLAAAGCDATPGRGWVLQLVPVTPPNHAPFEGIDAIDLVLELPDGSLDRHALPSTTGSPQLTGIPDLVDTRIAVETFRGQDLWGFGRTVPLTTGGEEDQAVNVLVGEADAMALVGEEPLAGYGAGVVAAGEGRFLVFGGGQVEVLTAPTYDWRTTASTSVLMLDVGRPEPDFALEEVAELPTYPAYDGTPVQGRIGATATLLDNATPLAGKVLVAGGVPAFFHYWDVTDTTFLYDIATGAIEEAAPLDLPRTDHLAIVNNDHEVVVMGGFAFSQEGYYPNPMKTIEIFDPATGKWERLDGELFGGGVGGAAVNVGTLGVLHCGGVEFSGTAWHTTDVDPLPEPVAWLTLTPIDAATILAAGGVSQPDPVDWRQDALYPATDGAWLFDVATRTWSEAPARMHQPRTRHGAFPLSGKRVLLVGGSAEGNYIWDSMTSRTALACAEVYDHDAGTFEELVPGCDLSSDIGTLPARANSPRIAHDPYHGTLVLGGADENGSVDTASLWIPAPDR